MFTKIQVFGFFWVQTNVPISTELSACREWSLQALKRRRNESHVVGVQQRGNKNAANIASNVEFGQNFDNLIDVDGVKVRWEYSALSDTGDNEKPIAVLVVPANSQSVHQIGLRGDWYMFLGSGPKGPMSCRTQGWISIHPSVFSSILLSFRPPPGSFSSLEFPIE